ncbi:MAG TPA: hypothetical protein VH835_02145 [Dongiaceae bacterium]|jgi:hypothetical protein
MHDMPPFGRELAEAQARLEEVLARCAIRLKPFAALPAANDNALFPGVCAPAGEAGPEPLESSRDSVG